VFDAEGPMSIAKLGRVEGVDRSLSANEKEVSSASTSRDPRLLDASRMYEKQFLREMVKAMRATVGSSEFTKPSMAEDIYRGQLDEQYVEVWSEQGGIGLADLIYNEVQEKHLNGKRREERNQGPLQLSDRDLLRVAKFRESPKEQTALRVELKSGQEPARITAPWDGKLVAKQQDGGRTTVILEHENNLRSAFTFDGVPTSAEPGSRLKSGSALGILNPDAGHFVWNVGASRPAGQHGF